MNDQIAGHNIAHITEQETYCLRNVQNCTNFYKVLFSTIYLHFKLNTYITGYALYCSYLKGLLVILSLLAY